MSKCLIEHSHVICVRFQMMHPNR